MTTVFDVDGDGDGPGGPVLVYTDGACSGNPGPGGWAWAVAPGGTPCGSGGEESTTNQRMEIRAAVEALTVLRHEPAQIVVMSDSTYVVNCFRDRWWARWQANGWRNAKKQPVANADLWRALVGLVAETGATFQWVKGHSGDRMNDLVDQMAVSAIPRRSTLPRASAASSGPVERPPGRRGR